MAKCPFWRGGQRTERSLPEISKHEDAAVWRTRSHQEVLFEVVDVCSSPARCYSLVCLQTYLEQDGCFDF